MTELATNSPVNIIIPIAKIDEEKRLVIGRAADEMPDKSKEVMDYESSKPNFIEWSEHIKELSNGKSLGNVRAMHGKTAAGKLVELTFNDNDRAVDVVAKVTDDNEWKKVLDGVYTGFSIGGSYAKRWNDPNNPELTRYTAKPSEISLVDNPCIPSARFYDLVKADGSVERRVFKNVTTIKVEDEAGRKARKVAGPVKASVGTDDSDGQDTSEPEPKEGKEGDLEKGALKLLSSVLRGVDRGIAGAGRRAVRGILNSFAGRRMARQSALAASRAALRTGAKAGGKIPFRRLGELAEEAGGKAALRYRRMAGRRIGQAADQWGRVAGYGGLAAILWGANKKAKRQRQFGYQSPPGMETYYKAITFNDLIKRTTKSGKPDGRAGRDADSDGKVNEGKKSGAQAATTATTPAVRSAAERKAVGLSGKTFKVPAALKLRLPRGFAYDLSTPLANLPLSRMDRASVVMDLEDELGHPLDDKKLASIKTVGDLVAMVGDLKNKSAYTKLPAKRRTTTTDFDNYARKMKRLYSGADKGDAKAIGKLRDEIQGQYMDGLLTLNQANRILSNYKVSVAESPQARQRYFKLFLFNDLIKASPDEISEGDIVEIQDGLRGKVRSIRKEGTIQIMGDDEIYIASDNNPVALIEIIDEDGEPMDESDAEYVRSLTLVSKSGEVSKVVMFDDLSKSESKGNPYRDKWGRFTSKEKAAFIIGATAAVAGAVLATSPSARFAVRMGAKRTGRFVGRQAMKLGPVRRMVQAAAASFDPTKLREGAKGASRQIAVLAGNLRSIKKAMRELAPDDAAMDALSDQADMARHQLATMLSKKRSMQLKADMIEWLGTYRKASKLKARKLVRDAVKTAQNTIKKWLNEFNEKPLESLGNMIGYLNRNPKLAWTIYTAAGGGGLGFLRSIVNREVTVTPDFQFANGKVYMVYNVKKNGKTIGMIGGPGQDLTPGGLRSRAAEYGISDIQLDFGQLGVPGAGVVRTGRYANPFASDFSERFSVMTDAFKDDVKKVISQIATAQKRDDGWKDLEGIAVSMNVNQRMALSDKMKLSGMMIGVDPDKANEYIADLNGKLENIPLSHFKTNAKRLQFFIDSNVGNLTPENRRSADKIKRYLSDGGLITYNRQGGGGGGGVQGRIDFSNTAQRTEAGNIAHPLTVYRNDKSNVPKFRQSLRFHPDRNIAANAALDWFRDFSGEFEPIEVAEILYDGLPIGNERPIGLNPDQYRNHYSKLKSLENSWTRRQRDLFETLVQKEIDIGNLDPFDFEPFGKGLLFNDLVKLYAAA